MISETDSIIRQYLYLGIAAFELFSVNHGNKYVRSENVSLQRRSFPGEQNRLNSVIAGRQEKKNDCEQIPFLLNGVTVTACINPHFFVVRNIRRSLCCVSCNVSYKA
jgi:hypothetical protein